MPRSDVKTSLDARFFFGGSVTGGGRDVTRSQAARGIATQGGNVRGTFKVSADVVLPDLPSVVALASDRTPKDLSAAVERTVGSLARGMIIGKARGGFSSGPGDVDYGQHELARFGVSVDAVHRFAPYSREPLSVPTTRLAAEETSPEARSRYEKAMQRAEARFGAYVNSGRRGGQRRKWVRVEGGYEQLKHAIDPTGSGRPNLTLTGKMFEDLRVRSSGGVTRTEKISTRRKAIEYRGGKFVGDTELTLHAFGLEVGFATMRSLEIALYHQNGYGRMPARPFLFLTDSETLDLRRVAAMLFADPSMLMLTKGVIRGEGGRFARITTI